MISSVNYENAESEAMFHGNYSLIASEMDYSILIMALFETCVENRVLIEDVV